MHLRGKIDISVFKRLKIQFHIGRFDLMQFSSRNVLRPERIGLHRREDTAALAKIVKARILRGPADAVKRTGRKRDFCSLMAV